LASIHISRGTSEIPIVLAAVSHEIASKNHIYFFIMSHQISFEPIHSTFYLPQVCARALFFIILLTLLLRNKVDLLKKKKPILLKNLANFPQNVERMIQVTISKHSLIPSCVCSL
jgi:hypothetical protein